MSTKARMKRVQDQRNAVNREMSALKKAAGLTNMQQWGRPKAGCHVFYQDASKVPADTRTVTGRICGDPLSGRSALDRRPHTAGD